MLVEQFNNWTVSHNHLNIKTKTNVVKYFTGLTSVLTRIVESCRLRSLNVQNNKQNKLLLQNIPKKVLVEQSSFSAALLQR